MWRTLLRSTMLLLVLGAAAPAADAVKFSPSKVTAVTVYQTTALVTREVELPAAAGLTEVVVSPMPAHTMPNSLYAEGNDGTRVLSARFRSRAIAEDTREEVRKLEARIHELNDRVQTMQADSKAMEQNSQFLTKLETFTTKALEHLTDKGQLDSDKVILLAKYVSDERTKRAKEDVLLKQQIAKAQEEVTFAKRQLDEASGPAVRTERDAVLVVDKKAGAGTIKLNYLVAQASWKPSYKYRAGAKENEKITIEYLAAIEQQTGEDWGNVDLVLSTAQPLLNAAPPDLRTLEVAIGGSGLNPANPGGKPSMAANQGFTHDVKELTKQSQTLRSQATDNLRMNNDAIANTYANSAAALEQFRDLCLTTEDLAKGDSLGAGMVGDGPSVTFRLKNRLTIPSRSDEQIVEVTRIELDPKFYYKAVPVLTPNVYRLADLTNTSDLVLLPGDATMYLGTDFVGQAKLPLVAMGKPFTVGFGVDPQLQVSRKLVDRTRTTQGGNQVLTFHYRILLSGYKANPVPVQVWDRMPHSEAVSAIAVTLTNPSTKLSDDPLYKRDDLTKNLLRWDVTLAPKQNGDKALAIDYDFKMELDRTVSIGTFISK